MADLGELRAKITAELDQFERGMDSATKKTEEFGNKTQASSRKADTGIKSVDRALKALSNPLSLAVVGASAAAAAFVAMAASGMKAGDEHAKLARAMGLTNTELAVLKRAADLSGLSVGQLETSTRALNRALVDAQDGTGRAAETFEALGLSAADIVDLDMESQLTVLGSAFEGIESRAQRASMAQDLFGRSGMHMLNLLEDAEGTFARAGREVDQFGLALTDVESGAIERANDNISTLRAAFGGMAQQLAATVAPSVERVTSTLIGLVAQLANAQREIHEFNRASQRVGTEQEQAEDRLLSLMFDRQKLEADHNAQRLRDRQMTQAAHERSIANIDEEIRKERDKVHQIAYTEAMSRRSHEADQAAAAVAAEAEAKAAAAQAERAAQLQVWLGRVNEAYAQTKEGRLEAIDAEIAWFQNAQNEASRTAHMFEPVLAMLREQRDLLAGGGEGSQDAHQEREALFTSQLERLEEYLMSEEELIHNSHQKRIDTVLSAMENMEITTSEAQRRIEALEQAHQDKLTDIAEHANRRRTQLAVTASTSIAGNLVSAYADMAQATGTNEKKMFDIRKRAAIATAVINAALGISQTLATYPWPLSGVMAAAHGLAAAAQIAAISKQSYNGGSTSPTIPSPSTPSEAESGGGGGTSRSLMVQGDFDSGALFTGDMVRQLIDRIAEAQEDGYTVVMV